MKQTLNENSTITFESLPADVQQKVLKIKEVKGFKTIEEVIGWVQMISIEKAYLEYKQKGCTK